MLLFGAKSVKYDSGYYFVKYEIREREIIYCLQYCVVGRFFISVPEYNSIYYNNEKVIGQRRSIP